MSPLLLSTQTSISSKATQIQHFTLVISAAGKPKVSQVWLAAADTS